MQNRKARVSVAWRAGVKGGMGCTRRHARAARWAQAHALQDWPHGGMDYCFILVGGAPKIGCQLTCTRAQSCVHSCVVARFGSARNSAFIVVCNAAGVTSPPAAAIPAGGPPAVGVPAGAAGPLMEDWSALRTRERVWVTTHG